MSAQHRLQAPFTTKGKGWGALVKGLEVQLSWLICCEKCNGRLDKVKQSQGMAHVGVTWSTAPGKALLERVVDLPTSLF